MGSSMLLQGGLRLLQEVYCVNRFRGWQRSSLGLEGRGVYKSRFQKCAQRQIQGSLFMMYSLSPLGCIKDFHVRKP